MTSKKWKKKPKRMARAPEAKGIDHKKLPVGQIVSQPVKGKFLALPLFGWIALRDKVETPLVMITCLLMPGPLAPDPKGTLQIELPLIEETEMATVAALERFGWDGRVWPGDPGWPEETDDQTNIMALLEQAGLAATMVFPSGDEGTMTQTVNVERAKGPFLMPPLPQPDQDPDPSKVERLRQLRQDPSVFYHIDA
jgi:hypothetical protein